MNERAAMSQSDIARFWSKIAKGSWSACWDWQASCRQGYGAFKVQGKVYDAHRIAFELAHRPLAVGEEVLHRCDRRVCCNPAHLTAGTSGDNYFDMVARGEPFDIGAWQREHPERRQRGEQHKDAKLTEAQVRQIRRRAAMGVMQKRLAFEYGVSRTTVSEIVRWKIWTHLRDEQAAALAEAA